MDPAVQRFMAARASHYDYWRPTWKSFWFFIGVQIVPMIGYSYMLAYEAKTKETAYREGRVPAKDRLYKHIFVSDNLIYN